MRIRLNIVRRQAMISNMGNSGHNAASLIAGSSPLGPLNDFAILPPEVLSLMQLPEPVEVVRAKGNVVFHLAEKRGLRGDTSLYPWLFECTRAMLLAPTFYMPGDKSNHHRLLGRPVSTSGSNFPIILLSGILKFVPSSSPRGSGKPELWLSTIEVHSETRAASYLRRATRVGA